MRIAKCFYLFVLVFPLFGQINDPKSLSISEQVPLTQFINGRWQGEFQQQFDNGTETILYQLEFIEPGTLVINRKKRGSVDLYNIVLEYNFYSTNQVHIRGRYIDDLQIAQDGDHLMIISKGSLIPDGRYRRVPTIPWPVLGIGLMILPLLLTFGVMRDIRTAKRERDIQNNKMNLIWSKYVLHIIVTAVLLGIGILIGKNMWQLWPHLMIRLPWDALIMIELGLMISALGVKMIVNNWIMTSSSKISIRYVWHYLGIIFIGHGVIGSIMGITEMLIYTLFRSYV